MSADNWGICPKCWAKARSEHTMLTDSLESLYGQIPLDEFDVMRARQQKGVNDEDYRTLREDYEFYLNEDTWEFYASYSGWCTECSWGFDFKHVEDKSTTP